MKSLQEPIREVLQDGVSEEAIQRVWKGVQRRRSSAGLARFWERAWNTPRGPRAAFAFVLVALSLVVGVVWFARTNLLQGGPLREANGNVPNSLGTDSASTTWLADGSRIDLSPGAALEVLDNDAGSFVCVLRRGRGTFEVKPGGPRRWRVEAGALRVEVIGTRFTVDRGKSRVSVEVDHGTVLVRGERVPDGVQKLTAGSRLLIEVPDPARASASTAPASSVAAASLPAPVTPAGGSSAGSASEPLAATSPGQPVNVDLLQLADEQRRHGNVKGAIATLRAAASAGSDSSRRAIAAFTLGKLLLENAGRPGEAAQAFRSCLRMSPPAAVAEDASARLVEALARSGNVEAALRSARDYERRYPSGRRLADVRRWTKQD
ncbi:MAG: FecR domain-containing protein [Myxococcota bacterium]